jgi:hypothetical protein
MHIKPTHDSLRSRRDDNTHHVRCWALEGSQDGKSWVALDRRENNAALNNKDVIATFSISESIKGRMLRLHQLNTNSNGSNYLFVSAIEIFGVVFEPKQYTCQSH